MTRGFLEYCRHHKIKVPCYPAHGTHVFQGLDVVVFSPLKSEYGKQRDALLRETGEAVSKENFLKVYGEAHLAALKPDLIRTAFRKTGIVPFDRSVITTEMMAPSRDSSFKVFTPVIPPTPVRIVTDLIIDTVQPVIPSSEDTQDSDLTPTKVVPHSQAVRIAMPQLASSSAAFLLSKSPIKSSSNLPDLPTMEMSPIKRSRKRGNLNIQVGTSDESELLTIPVTSSLEKRLQEALVLKNAEANFFRGRVIQLQSAMVLQRVYCGRVRRQLNGKERKAERNSKKGRREKIDGEGLGRLLTDDEIFNAVVEHEAAMEAEDREKEARTQKKVQFDIELAEWTTNEELRKE
jgi:hypothetical protein